VSASRSLAILIGVITSAGCAAGLPPSQTAIGGMIGSRGGGVSGSAGAHAKAADRRDRLDVDLGAGYLFERRAGAVAHGTYVALARRLPLGGRRDLWIGGRIELFWLADDGEPTRGVALRVAVRHHVGGVSAGASDGKAGVGAYGAFAVGAHADVGVRSLEGGGAAFMVSAGVTLDLPLLVGIGHH